MHLLSPSLHRFEKLKTQLKWRLIEGGSQALYELGVVDDGTLVGLSKPDMDASLATLGRMLAGLGGGHVRVNRVFRLAGDGSRDHGLTAAQHKMHQLDEDEAENLFNSFSVNGEEHVLLVQPDDDEACFPYSLDLDLDLSVNLDPPPIPIPPASDGPPARLDAPVHSPPFCGRRSKKPSHDKDKPAHHWAQRTPEERAALKRAKRDKSRRRSDAHPAHDLNESCMAGPDALPPAPPAVPMPAKTIPAANRRKPSLKLSRSDPNPGTVVHKLRPSLLREGEERWVVEVEVSKRSCGRRGDGVGVGEDEAETDGDGDGEGEEDGNEPEHGWSYLEFDFLGPSGGLAAAR